MTFYSIIFGILFLGAVRELLVSIVEANVLKCLMALTLVLVVFNDTLYTSHYIEQERGIYTLEMKLLDLVNFLVLACSIFFLSPNDNIFYRLDTSTNYYNPGIFWGLLVIYWLFAGIWNYCAIKTSKKKAESVTWVNWAIGMLLLASTILAFLNLKNINIIISSACALAFIVYIGIYKPLASRKNRVAL